MVASRDAGRENRPGQHCDVAFAEQRNADPNPTMRPLVSPFTSPLTGRTGRTGPHTNSSPVTLSAAASRHQAPFPSSCHAPPTRTTDTRRYKPRDWVNVAHATPQSRANNDPRE